jgi:hypothetical protein
MQLRRQRLRLESRTSFRSSKHLGAGLRKFHVGPAFVHRDPAALDRELHSRLGIRQGCREARIEIAVDLLDADSAVLQASTPLAISMSSCAAASGSGIDVFHLGALQARSLGCGSRWDGNNACLSLSGVPNVRGGPRRERSNLASYCTARSSNRRLMNGSAFSASKRQCAACCFRNSLSITPTPGRNKTFASHTAHLG